MFSPDSRSMTHLVNQLKRSGSIQSRIVEEVMLKVDRGFFCQPGSHAYFDTPQGIGCQQTISAPHIHAMSLEVLKEQVCQRDAKVLDVGSGSGYVSAAFAKMNPSAHVFGIERYDDLVQWSKSNVKKLGYSLPNLELRRADGWEGLLHEGPFDAINVGAAAESIPVRLANSLKIGGVMLIPVGPKGGSQKMLRVKRRRGHPTDSTFPDVMQPSDFEILEDTEVAFVPLIKDSA